MGKSQYKKKTQGRRHNPIRVPDAHLGAGKGENAAKEKEMLPILNKLKSPQHADRTWACAAICNLVQNDPATRRLFLGRNVVGELIERLSDTVEEVVVEASGTLRNLAIDGGYELCGEMFNKGIMAHITVLIGKVSNTIDSILSSNSSAAQSLTDEQMQSRKHLLALAENIISLIWSLTEANHKTLTAVNGAGVEGLLLKVLQGRQIMGVGGALAAAQAMYALSQDNPPFQISMLQTTGALQLLVDTAREEHSVAGKAKGKGKGKANSDVELADGRPLLTRILICGVLRNLVEGGNSAGDVVDIASLTNMTILPLVNSLLNLSLDTVVSQFYEEVAKVPEQDVTAKLGKGLQIDHRSAAEQALEILERRLSTVVVALEILTGICAGLEDVEEEDEDGTRADDVDEEMEADDLPDEGLIDMARTIGIPADDIATPSIQSAATLPHLITTLLFPQRLTQLSLPTTLSFPPSTNQPSPHPPATSVLSVLHLRALEALNNLLLIVVASLPSDIDATSQVAATIPRQGVWDGMFRIIDTLGAEPEALAMKGQEMRLEVLEMALGCLWGLVRLSSDRINVQAEQIQTLMNVLRVLQTDLARTRCIENLSTLASRPNISIDENRAVGTWLVQLLTASDPSLSMEVITAALNAIFEIYADEAREYDQPVFIAGGFLEALTGIMGRVRSEARKVDKRKHRELRARAEEASENLAAFIKYRRNLLR